MWFQFTLLISTTNISCLIISLAIGQVLCIMAMFSFDITCNAYVQVFASSAKTSRYHMIMKNSDNYKIEKGYRYWEREELEKLSPLSNIYKLLEVDCNPIKTALEGLFSVPKLIHSTYIWHALKGMWHHYLYFLLLNNF